jgi:hypothetical protein
VDRRTPHGVNSNRSMQTLGCSTLKLLLQERAHQSDRVTTDATCRRDLYSTAFFRIAQDHAGTEKRRAQSQSQTRPEDYAAVRAKQQPARTQHFKIASRTYQVPLPAWWRSSVSTSRSLEHRHHIYPPAQWVCIPRCRDRLVQPPGPLLSTLEQPGNKLLPRSLRRGHRTLRTTSNLQYRSRSAIYLKRVRASSSWSKYSLQHGWAWACARQCVCGTAMEVGQV